MDGNKTVVVKFKEKVTPPPAPTQYTLTASVDGGHGTVDPTSKTVNKDESVTITFTPDTGYEIDEVKVNDTPTTVSGNSLTLTMDGNKTVVVRYKATTPPIPPTPSIPDDYERPHRPYRPYRPSYEDKDDKREEKTEEDRKEIETKVVITIGSNQLDKDINGINKITTMDAAPYIKNGRTMLPIRYVAEALGLSVEWINETRTVIIQDMFFKVEIPVDTNLIIVNGVQYESDVKPEIVNNRTMLPIANIARALGLKDNVNIFWDAVNRKVTIIK